MVRNVGTFGKRKDKKTGKVTHTVSDTVVSGGEQKGDRKTSRFSNEKRVDAKDVPEQPDFVAAPKKDNFERITGMIESGKVDSKTANRLLDTIKPEQKQDELPKSAMAKVAEFGLAPAAWAANQLTGRRYDWRDIAEATAKTKTGKVLGVATVAAEAYLGGRVIAKIFPTMSRVINKGLLGGKGNIGKSGSLIGKRVNVNAIQKSLGLTKKQTGALAREIGKRRIGEVADLVQKGSLLNAKNILGISGTRIGLSVMVGWLGADNLSQSASIQARDIAQDLRFGNTTPEQAMTDLDTLQGYINTSRIAVIGSGIISPILIPISIMFNESVNSAQNQIDNARRLAERG